MDIRMRKIWMAIRIVYFFFHFCIIISRRSAEILRRLSNVLSVATAATAECNGNYYTWPWSARRWYEYEVIVNFD